MFWVNLHIFLKLTKLQDSSSLNHLYFKFLVNLLYRKMFFLFFVYFSMKNAVPELLNPLIKEHLNIELFMSNNINPVLIFYPPL